MMRLNVLIGCECSGAVRDAFRRLGHEAWSSDLEGIEPEGEWPNYHLEGDVRLWLDGSKGPCRKWDLLIAHPPCTYLTNSCAWAFGDGPYHQKIGPDVLVGEARRGAREEAVSFVKELLAAPIRRKAIENPVGCLSTRIRKPDQIIQPYYFGDNASKATCLWLENLPLLESTKYVPPTYYVEGRPRWKNQSPSGAPRLGPSEDRAKIRSVTFPGVAAAMAEQWGGELTEEGRRTSLARRGQFF